MRREERERLAVECHSLTALNVQEASSARRTAAVTQGISALRDLML